MSGKNHGMGWTGLYPPAEPFNWRTELRRRISEERKRKLDYFHTERIEKAIDREYEGLNVNRSKYA